MENVEKKLRRAQNAKHMSIRIGPPQPDGRLPVHSFSRMPVTQIAWIVRGEQGWTAELLCDDLSDEERNQLEREVQTRNGLETGKPERRCPRCSRGLLARHCKLVCEGCGYTEDCTDL